jgi:hypothetical protein
VREHQKTISKEYEKKVCFRKRENLARSMNVYKVAIEDYLVRLASTLYAGREGEVVLRSFYT